MPALSLQIKGKASNWLRKRSRELGIPPEAIVEDLISGQEAADEFLGLSEEVGRYARAQGLTSEKLTGLLDGEVHE